MAKNPKPAAAPGYKTTRRKRESAQSYRQTRSAARKPQAREVDEALSAALKKLVLQIKKGDYRKPMTAIQVYDVITTLAMDHLAEKRDSAVDQAKAAVLERLSKARKYPSSKA